MSGSSANRITAANAPLAIHAISRPPRRWKRWVVLVVLMAAAVIAVPKLRGNGSVAPVQYKTDQARRGNLVVTVSATGNLAPTNQVQVGSELSGTASSVAVEANDAVTVGQELARLDTTKLSAQMQQSQAALASAQAQVLSAQATVQESRGNLSRLNELHKLSASKAVSQHDLDAAQATLDRAAADEAKAKAAVSQARAVLDTTETDFAKTVIHSPINGVVLTRSIDPGQTVAASLQAPELFLLAEDLATMQLHVYVDEADVGVVHDGQDATFTVDAYPDRTFPAVIRRVSYGSKTTDGVVTYETILDLSNADLSLRPGMTATATIVVKRIEDALLVPNAALRFTPPATATAADAGGGSLFTKLMPHPPSAPAKTKTETNSGRKQPVVWTQRDGQLASVAVVTGATDGTMTEILSGELESDAVLATDTVKAGQ